MRIMSDVLKIDDIDETRSFTYADYLTWEGAERYQLFNGEAFMMASPSVEHQVISGALFLQFGNWLIGKPCKVLAAPLDVRLFPKEDNSDKTVVQPDILVVCDQKKLAKNSVNGAPDFIIEIVSPSNAYSDLFYKFQYYLEAGVREYWIIDPIKKNVQVHLYENGHFNTTLYKKPANMPVSIFQGLTINFEEIWQEAQ